MSDTNKDQLFEEMIYGFNFYKVREVMRFLDWKWWNSNDYPTVSTMKTAVKSMFDTCWNGSLSQGSQYAVESGGFRVTVDVTNNYSSLNFIVEQSEGDLN